MAVNQNHTENRRGVVIPYGESVLMQCRNVDLSFLQQPEGSNLFGGTKKGTLFLTSFRVIFLTSHSVNDPMFSFMMPFDLMSNSCTIEQPVFASNYIKGTIQAAPGGGWEGQAIFKLTFRRGGAITFAQLMMKAASAAAQGVPLGSMNYWFGAPGLYFITGQGGMMCNQGMPCPAYPVMMYGSQQMRYGTLPGGYGAPPAGYGAPPAGYGAPPVGYRAQSAGYGASPAGYGALPVGNGAPPGGSEALPAGYGAPPAGHESSLVGYGAPPVGNETLPAENEALPAENEAPPLGYEAPAAKNRAGSHKSVAAQPAGYEASLPSASSSQAYSPPSEK